MQHEHGMVGGCGIAEIQVQGVQFRDSRRIAAEGIGISRVAPQQARQHIGAALIARRGRVDAALDTEQAELADTASESLDRLDRTGGTRETAGI